MSKRQPSGDRVPVKTYATASQLELLRRAAALEGMSLSSWLMKAGVAAATEVTGDRLPRPDNAVISVPGGTVEIKFVPGE